MRIVLNVCPTRRATAIWDHIGLWPKPTNPIANDAITARGHPCATLFFVEACDSIDVLTRGSRIRKPKLMARYAGRWLRLADAPPLDEDGMRDESAGNVEKPKILRASDNGRVRAEATMVATIPALLRPPVSLLALKSALSFSMASSAKMSR